MKRCPGFPCAIISGSDIVGIPDLFFAYVGQAKGNDHFATRWVPGTKGKLKVWQYRKGKLVQKGRTVKALSNKLQRRTQKIPVTLPKDVPVTSARLSLCSRRRRTRRAPTATRRRRRSPSRRSRRLCSHS